MGSSNHDKLIEETQNQAIDPRVRDGKIKEALVGKKGISAAFETAKDKVKVIPQIITDKMKIPQDILKDILSRMGLAKSPEVEMGRA